MRIKIDPNSRAWNDARRHRGSRRLHQCAQASSPELHRQRAAKPGTVSARRVSTLSATASETPEALREDIKRGKEYLLQVRGELRQCRKMLDQWPDYEVTCCRRPLEHLIQSVWLKEQVEQFLVTWLSRMQRKLGAVSVRTEAASSNGKRHRHL